MTNKTDTTVALFFEAGRMIRKKLDKEDGVPFAQAEVLRFVCDMGSPTMRDLAKHLEISAPSATALVNQLADGGYLRREGDRTDRRQIHLFVSKKAEKALAAIMEKRKKVLKKLMLGLSAKDHDDMQRVLQKMLKNK